MYIKYTLPAVCRMDYVEMAFQCVICYLVVAVSHNKSWATYGCKIYLASPKGKIYLAGPKGQTDFYSPLQGYTLLDSFL